MIEKDKNYKKTKKKVNKKKSKQIYLLKLRMLKTNKLAMKIKKVN